MNHEFYEWNHDDLILCIKVQPKFGKDEFCDVMENRLKVRITALPVDGKANLYLIKFLSRQFKVSKSHIELLSGDTNREKRFRITRPRLLPSFILNDS